MDCVYARVRGTCIRTRRSQCIRRWCRRVHWLSAWLRASCVSMVRVQYDRRVASSVVRSASSERTFWPEGQLIRKKVSRLRRSVCGGGRHTTSGRGPDGVVNYYYYYYYQIFTKIVYQYVIVAVIVVIVIIVVVIRYFLRLSSFFHH